MFKKIMVTLDGSTTAETALATAQALATSYESQLVLIRIVVPSYLTVASDMVDKASAKSLMELHEKIEEEAQAYLKRVQGQVERVIPNVTMVLEKGSAVSYALLEYARHHQIDLIVMASHGWDGLGHWLMGSNAEKVLRHAELPVLLVPATADGRR